MLIVAWKRMPLQVAGEFCVIIIIEIALGRPCENRIIAFTQVAHSVLLWNHFVCYRTGKGSTPGGLQ